jgi:hypothetical protein
MIYELAKQLKDAGFPQRVRVGGSFYHFISHPSAGIPPQQAVNTSFVHREIFDDDVAIPTLSELIEACEVTRPRAASPWFSLGWNNEGWSATIPNVFSHIDLLEGFRGDGATPEEAVARLWLALNRTQSPPGASGTP